MNTETSNLITTMTAYEKLKAHIAKHRYTKGQYVGDAPAMKRTWTHMRTSCDASRAFIIMHNTRILVADINGAVTIDAGGWEDTPTTRRNIAEVTGKFWHKVRLHTLKFRGARQTAITINGKTWVYASGGMRFSADGELIGTPLPFDQRILNRDKTKVVRERLKDFRAVLPLLWASVDSAATPTLSIRPISRRDFFESEGSWPAPEDYAMITTIMRRKCMAYNVMRRQYTYDHKLAYKTLYDELRDDCYDVTDSEITCITKETT